MRRSDGSTQRHRHDPLTQLNDRHRDLLVAVARAFGGHTDATDALATLIDDDGIELAIATPNGQVIRRVEFSAAGPARTPADTRSRRLAFRQLARRASAELLSSAGATDDA
jgi:Domain of unknown function (DUF2470)